LKATILLINADKNPPEESTDLYLTEPPEIDSLFKFVIKVYLDTDSVFTDTTKTIKLIK
jgi:hypothetical protein